LDEKQFKVSICVVLFVFSPIGVELRLKIRMRHSRYMYSWPHIIILFGEQKIRNP